MRDLLLGRALGAGIAATNADVEPDSYREHPFIQLVSCHIGGGGPRRRVNPVCKLCGNHVNKPHRRHNSKWYRGTVCGRIGGWVISCES